MILNHRDNKLFFYRIYIQLLKEQSRKKQYKNYKKLINDTHLKFEKYINYLRGRKNGSIFIEHRIHRILARFDRTLITQKRLNTWLSLFLITKETKLILLDLFFDFKQINPLNWTYYEKIRKEGIKWNKKMNFLKIK